MWNIFGKSINMWWSCECTKVRGLLFMDHGGSTHKSPVPCHGPHLTQCVIGPHKCTCQMAYRSVERFEQGARMWRTDDRQTDHATEKRRIACAAAVIPPRKRQQNCKLVDSDTARVMCVCIVVINVRKKIKNVNKRVFYEKNKKRL